MARLFLVLTVNQPYTAVKMQSLFGGGVGRRQHLICVKYRYQSNALSTSILQGVNVNFISPCSATLVHYTHYILCVLH